MEIKGLSYTCSLPTGAWQSEHLCLMAVLRQFEVAYFGDMKNLDSISHQIGFLLVPNAYALNLMLPLAQPQAFVSVRAAFSQGPDFFLIL